MNPFNLTPRTRGALLISLIAGLASTSGCTSITITEADGTVRIDRSLGFARVEVAPGTRAISARIDALGMSDTPLGVGIGVSRQQFTALGDDCRVVVWIESAEAAEALTSQLSDLKNLCIVNQSEGTTQ